MLGNRAVIAVAQQYIIGEVELHRESTWMQILPLFIAYGVTCSLMIPLVVGMILIVRIPTVDTILQLCEKFKPKHIMCSPPYWEKFANDCKDIDLSYLVAPISGGDILYPLVETKVNEYLKKQGSSYLLMNGYGMTEVAAAVSVNYKYAHRFGSVGIPFVKNVISAFDIETGEELKSGQEGEICIQTPSVMMGYINNQEETDNIIKRHSDGLFWVHSGDLGYVSEDGFVYISGRLKRYIIYATTGIYKKVFSLDIERVILNAPKIAKCAVVPIKDEATFQVPVAYIIWKKGYGSKEDLEAVREFAEEHLEGGYRPVEYIPVDTFPLTRVGKIDYLTLEKMANAESEA